jgi:signal transduction histidine kinase
MRRFRDLPVGRKLVAVSVAASALALAVSGAVFLVSSFLFVRDGVRDDLQVQAESVATNASAAVAFSDLYDADETLQVLQRLPSVDLACLYKLDKKLFTAYRRPGVPRTCPEVPPEPGDIAGAERATFLKTISYRDVPHGTLLMVGNFDQVWGRLAPQTLAALAGIIVGGIAAIVLSARIQRVVSRPILELSSTARTISHAGDYSLRAAKHANDETGHLVDSFNAMVSEIERRDEQLRAASRLKDEFLAALSHELRTPLNAMLGWTQVLRTGKATPEVIDRAYESIERNARAQATLIEDLLDISRIVSGKLNLRSDPVDLTAVVEAALEVVRPAAEAKDITIVRQLAPSPQYVVGDVDRLQQIAWNLLSNAVKFCGKGGHVQVTVRAESDHYHFEVRDDGVGIAPDFLPHVFDRFRQGDGSLTRRHGGLGLGLAIVRELAQLHGGRVSALSEGTGKGAAFVVELPRPAGLASVQGREGFSRASRLDGVSVLVVDDDDDARELATIVLSGVGAKVQATASAAEARSALNRTSFDVIVSDLAMPTTDGHQLLRGLRADSTQRGANTPAIALTAHAGVGAESQAHESGFQSVVTKPYDLETLVAAIRHVLR